ncbi:hypothetical protein Droror1_Dr00006237 [Drosera rotundifolia]
MALLSLIAGFLAGALTVLAAEALGFLYLLRHLTASKEEPSRRGASDHVDRRDCSSSSVYQKQGAVWILEPENIPKVPSSGERNKKKDILEVSPVRKFAKIKDQSLILTDPDGSRAVVLLKGCRVVAVSATSLPSKKWAKRYPIRVESKTAELYNESNLIYIYLETSSEKESWCKALRFTASEEKETRDWLLQWNEEFNTYLRSLIEAYPSLVKPYGVYDTGPSNKDSNNDLPSSKVWTFLRKLSKKVPKSSPESRLISSSVATHEERRVVVEKSRSFQDGFARHAFKGKLSTAPAEDASSAHSVSQSNGFEIFDSDADEKNVIDEGTLCWNLLISRLFFDAKSNVNVRSALKAKIQRSLSNMRIPSYIGEVTCTDVDPGNLPPSIHSMRAVPTDMNDVWAIEMDIEYSGGMVLYVESRLEVGELDAQNGVVAQNMESGSDGELTTHLLEGFEQHEELNHLGMTIDSIEQKDLGENKVDRITSVKKITAAPNSESRWKSIVNTVAKQVNQVSFSLAIRVESLKGTMQFHIKPPPSDQLWVGFSSMPDINFQVEPSVGDHKLSSTRIALLLVNRFKAVIREAVVLPNCESLTIPFMLSEKNDWIPRNLAPLLWVKRDAPSNPKPVPETIKDQQETKDLKQKKPDPTPESVDKSGSSHSQEAAVQECSQHPREENLDWQLQTRYVSLKEERSILGEDEDGKGKKTGKRAKMRELAKKMGEKLEEKKHHLEEKSRLIVEKMRTSSTSSS